MNRTSSYPKVILIPSKSEEQVFTAADQRVTPKYKCDLCGVSFNIEEGLTSHVKAEHS